MQAVLDDFLDSAWNTLKRVLLVYSLPQVAYISTTTANPRFAQHDQNVFNPQVTPQAQTIYGIIRYGTKQPWDYIEPQSRTAYSQQKIRDSEGEVTIKVDAAGYALLKDVKRVVVDDGQFQLISTPRPNTLFTPKRWQFRYGRLE